MSTVLSRMLLLHPVFISITQFEEGRAGRELSVLKHLLLVTCITDTRNINASFLI
jgi:hypothetical protein